jgi:hypothetical protein
MNAEVPGVRNTGWHRRRRGAIVSYPQRSSPQRPTGASSPDPVLITDAARSYEEDLATRKRRYALMMGMRIPCMVLAALFYQTPWLAVTLLVLSIPLPWMAVLIANDRLPRKREQVNRFPGDRLSLESRAHPLVEERPSAGSSVIDGEVLGSRLHSDERVTRFPGHPDARRAG